MLVLTSALSANTSLIALRAASCSLCDDGVALIAQSLARHPSLKEVNFSNNRQGGGGSNKTTFRLLIINLNKYIFCYVYGGYIFLVIWMLQNWRIVCDRFPPGLTESRAVHIAKNLQSIRYLAVLSLARNPVWEREGVMSTMHFLITAAFPNKNGVTYWAVKDDKMVSDLLSIFHPHPPHHASF